MINKSEEQNIAFSYAIQDIINGSIPTLWTTRLEQEYPEMYVYALRQVRTKYPEKYERALVKIEEEERGE